MSHSKRRNLVADEAVKDATGLLRVDQVGVDVARMEECLLHGALGDLVEGHAADGDDRALLRFLAVDPISAQLFSQVSGNGLALAVGIRRQVDGVRRLGQLLQLGDDFFLAGNDDVLGGEVVVQVDAERLLGQVFDVPERGFHVVARAEIFLDRLRLSGRLDDD